MEGAGVTVPGDVPEEMKALGGLVVKVVISQQLDSMILEAFSSLTDSMIILIIQFAK